MDGLPHHYTVTAMGSAKGVVDITSEGLAALETAAPAQFGGPGDKWSPETLLVAAVADCFVLTFRAIAQASKMEWASINCVVDGKLERVDGTTQFSEFRLRVALDVPQGTDEQKALRLLDKSEHSCLITNSLSATTHIDSEVRVAQQLPVFTSERKRREMFETGYYRQSLLLIALSHFYQQALRAEMNWGCHKSGYELLNGSAKSDCPQLVVNTSISESLLRQTIVHYLTKPITSLS